MKRSAFIKRSGLSALTAWLGSSMILQACHTEEDMIGEPNWIVEGSFDRVLPVPPVSEGNTSLDAGFSVGELLKGRSTTTLSYADGLLGPTIKAGTGDTVNVSLQNSLSQETNIHWHGLILPEDMDGHPKDVASPGESLNYSLPVIQRAGTYWYHPHPHGATARQVFMGLAGMFIVNDPEETSLNLPGGEFEIPLIIQDKRFEGNNLSYSPTGDEIMTGYLGEQVLINGVHAPFINVASGWYRLRILNGSTARIFNLAFSGGHDMIIIGSDGGLLPAPEPVPSAMLGPGERIDVLIDFSGLDIGKEISLVSTKFSEFNVQGRQAFNLLKFRVDRAANNSFTLPATLSAITTLSPQQSANTRTFDIAQTSGGEGGHNGMARHSINGKTFEMDRVDETVVAGTTEIRVIDNSQGDEIHPMHIHGVQFQVLERVGGRNKILASEMGWKDTILLMPGEKVSLIMTFPEYTGVFVFHCHNLEHEDDGMMLNFRIISDP